MKQKILAVCLFVGIIAFVVVNSLFLQNTIDSLTDEIDKLSLESKDSREEFKEIDKKFKEKEIYIGLTVSHDDLTNIEDCFSELDGYLAVEDTEGAKVVKYRLIRFLKHLRRLVGFNIDTII